MKLFQYKGPNIYEGSSYAPDSRHFVPDEYWLLEKDDPILRCKPPLPFEEVEEPPDCDNVESLTELVETCKALRAWTNTVGRAMEWNLKTVGLVFKDHRATARALVIPRIADLIDAAVRLGRTERPATDGLDETGALAVLNGIVEWVGEVGEKPTVKSNNLPPEGTRFAEENVPAEFRDGGKLDQSILTVKYLADNTDWDLKGAYLSKHYGPGKTLTTRIVVGKAFAYLFSEVAALRRIKTQNEADRERR